jgi:hypothetical protein
MEWRVYMGLGLQEIMGRVVHGGVSGVLTQRRLRSPVSHMWRGQVKGARSVDRVKSGDDGMTEHLKGSARQCAALCIVMTTKDRY